MALLDKGDSGLGRRIRLYMYGIVVGLIAVYFMFHGRNLKELTPGMLKLDQLAGQTIQYTDTATCEMNCQGVSKQEIKDAMTDGKVDSKKSQDFHQKHPMFNFTGQTPGGKSLNIICVQIDSITQVTMVRDLAKKDTCKCP